MDPFDELWQAMENVNPTYHYEQWPKCPECGKNTDMTFYESYTESGLPSVIYCSCGWARVKRTSDGTTNM